MASIVKQASLFPILLVNFVGTLGFSIVLPFLVFVVMKFGGNAIVYGLLAATYPAFQLIGSPILGKLSDTYGRKKEALRYFEEALDLLAQQIVDQALGETK